MQTPRRRLYRSRADRMLGGVSGGLGDYFEVDPVLIRLVWVVLAVLTGGLFLLAYLLMWIIVPPEGSPDGPRNSIRQSMGEVADEARALAGEVREAFGEGNEPSPSAPSDTGPPRRRSDVRVWAAVILIGLGLIFLLDNLNLITWFNWGTFWPLVLVAIGLALLWQRTRDG